MLFRPPTSPLNPSTIIDVNLKMAQRRMNEGKFEDAIKCYTKAKQASVNEELSPTPENLSICYALSLVLIRENYFKLGETLLLSMAKLRNNPAFSNQSELLITINYALVTVAHQFRHPISLEDVKEAADYATKHGKLDSKVRYLVYAFSKSAEDMESKDQDPDLTLGNKDVLKQIIEGGQQLQATNDVALQFYACGVMGQLMDSATLEKDKAIKYLEEAYALYYKNRQKVQAYLQFVGKEIKLDFSDFNIKDLAHTLGRIYDEAHEFHDGAKAVKYHQIAADLNSVESCMVLAEKYENGEDVQVNYKKAAGFYKKAISLGLTRAITRYIGFLNRIKNHDHNLVKPFETSEDFLVLSSLSLFYLRAMSDISVDEGFSEDKLPANIKTKLIHNTAKAKYFLDKVILHPKPVGALSHQYYLLGMVNEYGLPNNLEEAEKNYNEAAKLGKEFDLKSVLAVLKKKKLTARIAILKKEAKVHEEEAERARAKLEAVKAEIAASAKQREELVLGLRIIMGMINSRVELMADSSGEESSADESSDDLSEDGKQVTAETKTDSTPVTAISEVIKRAENSSSGEQKDSVGVQSSQLIPIGENKQASPGAKEYNKNEQIRMNQAIKAMSPAGDEYGARILEKIKELLTYGESNFEKMDPINVSQFINKLGLHKDRSLMLHREHQQFLPRIIPFLEKANELLPKMSPKSLEVILEGASKLYISQVPAHDILTANIVQILAIDPSRYDYPQLVKAIYSSTRLAADSPVCRGPSLGGLIRSVLERVQEAGQQDATNLLYALAVLHANGNAQLDPQLLENLIHHCRRLFSLDVEKKLQAMTENEDPNTSHEDILNIHLNQIYMAMRYFDLHFINIQKNTQIQLASKTLFNILQARVEAITSSGSQREAVNFIRQYTPDVAEEKRVDVFSVDACFQINDNTFFNFEFNGPGHYLHDAENRCQANQTQSLMAALHSRFSRHPMIQLNYQEWDQVKTELERFKCINDKLKAVNLSLPQDKWELVSKPVKNKKVKSNKVTALSTPREQSSGSSPLSVYTAIQQIKSPQSAPAAVNTGSGLKLQ